MVTRNRHIWKLDNQGEYPRQIGWKHSRNGKLMQHKFRLGSDLKEAQRREQKIVEFWERIEETTDTTPVVWTDFTLDVAKQLAKALRQLANAQRSGRRQVPTLRGRRNQSKCPQNHFVCVPLPDAVQPSI